MQELIKIKSTSELQLYLFKMVFAIDFPCKIAIANPGGPVKRKNKLKEGRYFKLQS